MPTTYRHQFEDLHGRPEAGPDRSSSADAEPAAEDGREAPADAAAVDYEIAEDDAAGGPANPQASGDADAGGEPAPDLAGDIDRAVADNSASQRDAELAEMRAEIQRLRAERDQDSQAAADASLDDEIANHRQALVTATEEGDTSAAVDAQNKLVELQVKKSQQASAAGETTPPAPADIPAAAADWVRNNDWFVQNSHPAARRTALIIDEQLRSAGYDPNDAATYAELDRQLARHHPDINASAAPRKRPSAPTNGMGAQSAPRRSSRVRITASDREAMAEMGLDPNNAEHLKAWAAEVRAENAS